MIANPFALITTFRWDVSVELQSNTAESNVGSMILALALEIHVLEEH